MSKFLPLSLILVVLIAFAEPASAQGFLNKLSKKVQDKIEKKVEKKVDDKVDEKVDEELDKVFEGQDEDESMDDTDRDAARLQKMMKGFGMSGEPVPVEDDYTFDSKLQMHIETYNKDGKQESDGDFITYLDSKGKNFAYQFIGGDMQEKGKGMFIMDLKNKAMIILSEDERRGERQGVVYGLDMSEMDDWDEEVYNDLEEEEVPDVAMSPYVKKTGRTKSIEGYKCEEYLYNNPEDEVEASFWVSKDVKISTRDFMGALLKMSSYSHGMPWGFVMESESTDTETGERSIMRVTDLDTNANKKFSLSGYKITNIGSMQIPNMDGEE